MLPFGSFDNLRAEEKKEVARNLDRVCVVDGGLQRLNRRDTAAAVGARPITRVLNQYRQNLPPLRRFLAKVACDQMAMVRQRNEDVAGRGAGRLTERSENQRHIDRIA